MKTRPLSDNEYNAMLGAFCGRMAMRDQTLFLLQTATGFRISEMLSLRMRDVLSREGAITESISVARKNMKQFHKGKVRGRTVPIGPRERAALAAWINRLQSCGYVLPDDPIFPAMLRHEKKPIDRKSVWRTYKQAAWRAGIPVQGIGTHSTRKTFGTRMQKHFIAKLKVGELDEDPLRMTAKAMGHANINSTDLYLDFDMSRVDRAILDVQAAAGEEKGNAP